MDNATVFQSRPDDVILDSFYYSCDDALDEKPDAIFVGKNLLHTLKKMIAQCKKLRKKYPWITSVSMRSGIDEPIAVIDSDKTGFIEATDDLKYWSFMGVEIFIKDYKGEKDAIHVWFEWRHIDDADILIQAEVFDLAEDSGGHTGVEACRATQ